MPSLASSRQAPPPISARPGLPGARPGGPGCVEGASDRDTRHGLVLAALIGGGWLALHIGGIFFWRWHLLTAPLAHGAPLPDDLHARLGTLIDRACEIGDRADRAAYDAALVGLYLGLSPDEALFAQADADDGGSDAPGAGGPAKEGTEAPEPEGTPATEQPIDAKKDDDAGPQGDPKSDDEHSDGRRDAGRGAPDANTGADGRTHPNESRDRGEDRP